MDIVWIRRFAVHGFDMVRPAVVGVSYPSVQLCSGLFSAQGPALALLLRNGSRILRPRYLVPERLNGYHIPDIPLTSSRDTGHEWLKTNAPFPRALRFQRTEPMELGSANTTSSED